MPEVVLYRESWDVIRDIMPDFPGIRIPQEGFGGVTVQWPDEADVRQKHHLVTVLCEAVGKDLRSQTAFKSSKREVQFLDGWESFVSSVDEDIWWLGDIVAIFSNESRLAVLFPGSDGAFLHVCGSEELVTRVISAADATFSEFDWMVIEE